MSAEVEKDNLNAPSRLEEEVAENEDDPMNRTTQS